MRLIDADALIQKKRKGTIGNISGDFVAGFDIDTSPTIDAVPVVRCRECKFYREFRTKRYNQLMRMCYRMGKHDMEYPIKPDDFCSYGQRNEDEHD